MLIAWGIILGIAKGLKLENHGFSLTAYSLTYKKSASTKGSNKNPRQN